MLPGPRVKALRIAIFDGTTWTLSGDPVSAD
jgi:hypothetical protein